VIFNRYTIYRPGLFARLLPSGKWKLRLPTATAGSVELHTGTRAELRCLDITAIGIKKALLWHTVEVRTRNHVETLSCLGEEAASRLACTLFLLTFVYCWSGIARGRRCLGRYGTG